jgi:hypothetical protein
MSEPFTVNVYTPKGPRVAIVRDNKYRSIILKPKQAKRIASELRQWRKEYVKNGNK